MASGWCSSTVAHATGKGLATHALRSPCMHLKPSSPLCTAPSFTVVGPAQPCSTLCSTSKCSMFQNKGPHRALSSMVPQAHPGLGWHLLASVTASSTSAPALTGAAATSALPAYLTSVGIFIVCSAAAVFLVSAIPTLWALARLAHQATNVLRQVERELPETASMLRLSGLEVTDCINEFTGLGSDLSSGVRSAAQMVTMTESGVKQVAAVASSQLVPTLAANETAVRGVVEAGLQERAKMQYSLPLISQAASSTTSALRKVRLGVAVAQAASAAVRMGQAFRGRAQQVAEHYQRDGSRGASPDVS